MNISMGYGRSEWRRRKKKILSLFNFHKFHKQFSHTLSPLQCQMNLWKPHSHWVLPDVNDKLHHFIAGFTAESSWENCDGENKVLEQTGKEFLRNCDTKRLLSLECVVLTSPWGSELFHLSKSWITSKVLIEKIAFYQITTCEKNRNNCRRPWMQMEKRPWSFHQ